MGRAIARSLARHGTLLCLPGRRLEVLSELLQDLGEHAPDSQSYALDLEDVAEIQRFAVWVEETFPPVDILVHCAGVISLATVEDTPLHDLDRHLSTNVRAPILLTQALLPQLRRQRGQVVFINSSAGLTAKAGIAAYCASKHALKGFADSLRAEVNADGVRVLSIYPGRTATPMQAAVHREEGKPYSPERLLQPEDTAELVISALTLPRTAEVTDVLVRPMATPHS
jgi:NAD(P)-dependent dehydrogenase (short-subunit alcohol dehydrogenase family)